jgi:peptidoglycan-associated lipoprotein
MSMQRTRSIGALAGVALMAALAATCGRNPPPVARPIPPPPGPTTAPAPTPPAPPEPVREPVVVPPEPIAGEGDLAGRDLDALNRDSPFQPVLFGYDSADVDSAGQTALNANAELLKRYPNWRITIEGHADERGTAEYNLALGERRALAARTYLVSLGIPADRVQTVSYGKEFPFDPGHTEDAWARNRRAHFVVTAK